MTLKQGSKVKFDIAKDLKIKISKQWFSLSKPLGSMPREILGPPPPFDIKYLRQAFLATYILCKSDTASCNILNFRTYEHINDF